MEEHRLRPHRYVLWRGVGAILAFFVPTFGVLYFLTVPAGPWQLVLVGNIMMLGLLVYALIAYARLGVWVSTESIAERGFFSITKRYEAHELGSTVLANMYHGGWVETVPQLFVCDPAGRQVIRLRGQFWSLESMQTVASTLEVPAVELTHPITRAELHAKHPGLLYWFERHQWLSALIFAVILIGSSALLYVVLRVLGVAMF